MTVGERMYLGRLNGQCFEQVGEPVLFRFRDGRGGEGNVIIITDDRLLATSWAVHKFSSVVELLPSVVEYGRDGKNEGWVRRGRRVRHGNIINQ